MEIIEKTRVNVQKTNKEIVSQSLSLMSSAFILVAALAWNDAIKELINTYLKAGGGIISRFVYALIITALAVIITVRLNKILQKFKE